jgi:hypothetical protein
MSGMAELQVPCLPRWMPAAFVLLAVALAPWIVWLFVNLPDRELADHWALAWAGFDVGLSGFLAGTGIALARRSPFSALLAAMSGALLLTDAWFDVLTSRGNDRWIAVAMAACLELPLAAICLWVAYNIERVLADARPLMERAGLR